jgi:hypothetical protein
VNYGGPRSQREPAEGYFDEGDEEDVEKDEEGKCGRAREEGLIALRRRHCGLRHSGHCDWVRPRVVGSVLDKQQRISRTKNECGGYALNVDRADENDRDNCPAVKLMAGQLLSPEGS